MNLKDKFLFGVRCAYSSVFHKRNFIGKMGYIHDEMITLSNDYDYLKFNKEIPYKFCQTNHNLCKEGLIEFNQRNYKKAYGLFSQVPEKEYPEVLFCKAFCLLYGKGINKDEKQAIELLKQGESYGSLCCIQLLARCYIEGRYVSTNKARAAVLINAAADRYNNRLPDLSEDVALEDLSHFCGVYYFESGDFENAERYFKKAISSNFGLSYYYLGKIDYAKNDGETEFNQFCFDKARKLGVSVEAKYYAEVRSHITDESNIIDHFPNIENLTGTIENITESISNVFENINDAEDTLVKMHPGRKIDQVKKNQATAKKELAEEKRRAINSEARLGRKIERTKKQKEKREWNNARKKKR
ncbi:MAG: sel1 repeat family protein [Eubacterium sp.]|nr:sel1 repeat family protein [Eubacterium sp.]